MQGLQCPICMTPQQRPFFRESQQLGGMRLSGRPVQLVPAYRCSWRGRCQPLHRTHGRRKQSVSALLGLFGTSKKASTPPRPAKEFSKETRKRIKQDGPQIEDLIMAAEQEYEVLEQKADSNDGEEEVEKEPLFITNPIYEWVPPQVLGTGWIVMEPPWHKIKKMDFLTFYTGIQSRNWTSQFYDENAMPWKVAFYKENGRRFKIAHRGYRCLVTAANRDQWWVDLVRPGTFTFTEDYLAAGTRGGQWKAKRLPYEPQDLSDVGYNQIFEELFQAYQQRVPERSEDQMYEERWVDQDKVPYDCPGADKLDLSYHSLPAHTHYAAWFMDTLPTFAIYFGSVSFLFICLYIAIFRPRKTMPSDAFMAVEFAQSKGQARQEGKTGIKFADVAGMDQTIKDLDEIVQFLKNPKQYLALGTKPPKGVLLEGPPGTGKTLLAKAIAGEAGVPFYQMSGSEFVEAIVGVGAARVRDLFKRARVQEGPCIIFVDEIDAVGAMRASAQQETNEEREQTLNQLLTEMDGFTPDIGVVFLGATNRADLLDPALMRAGRFDKKIRISRPDTQGRYDVLQVHFRKRPVADDVDLMQLARDLPGLSGAELANVANEGAIECGRRGGKVISNLDIYNGIDRILQGVKRPGLPKRMHTLRSMAVYEVGKGLTATILRKKKLDAGEQPHLEGVERVTIVPRGREWTRTIFMRGADEDYSMATRARLIDRLRVLLAGRAAEEVLMPGGPTSYGVAALTEASGLATKMVANYGLTSLGITTFAPPLSNFGSKTTNYETAVDELDDDMTGANDDSFENPMTEEMMGRIKLEAQVLFMEAYEYDINLLKEHSTALDQATSLLLERETLQGNDLVDILSRYPPTEDNSSGDDNKIWEIPLEQRAFQRPSNTDRLVYVREPSPVA